MIAQCDANRKISIVIPSRNEAESISACLDSVLANDFPKEKLEILVVDGMSNDGTRELVGKYAEKYPFVKLLDNPKKNTSAALNIGIKTSRGRYIFILSSHSKVQENFIKTNRSSIEKYGADCVGGIITTLPANDSLVARAVALILSHPFGVGNSYFRIGSSMPKFVDTVPFGCYKKEVFQNIGLFDEYLLRNQDLEFNHRLKKAGGKILLIPSIASSYLARRNLRELFRQSFGNGFWVIYGLRFARLPFSVRHFVPLGFVFVLLCSVIATLFYLPLLMLFGLVAGIYLATNICFSCALAFKKGFNNLPLLILTFFTLHVSYGLGSLWGAARSLAYKS